MLLNKRRDKYREKQRRQNLQARKEEREKGKNRSKKVGYACATADANRVSRKRKLTGKQRQTLQTAEDEDELARDSRLLRKLKKRLITEDDYEKRTGTDLMI